MRHSFTLASALLLLGASAVLPVSAIAKAPVYQAAGPKGGVGYSTTQIEKNRYVVTYTGDQKMKRDQAASYALLRAAEFTQESGFEWFAVLNSSVREVEVGSADDVAGRTGNFMGNTATASTGTGTDQSAGGGSMGMGAGMSGGYGGGDVPQNVLEKWRPKTSVQAVLIIQMGNGDEANFEGATKQPDIFEAKSTAEELRASMKK
jgi:hypothetical protein